MDLQTLLQEILLDMEAMVEGMGIQVDMDLEVWEQEEVETKRDLINIKEEQINHHKILENSLKHFQGRDIA